MQFLNNSSGSSSSSSSEEESGDRDKYLIRNRTRPAPTPTAFRLIDLTADIPEDPNISSLITSGRLNQSQDESRASARSFNAEAEPSPVNVDGGRVTSATRRTRGGMLPRGRGRGTRRLRNRSGLQNRSTETAAGSSETTPMQPNSRPPPPTQVAQENVTLPPTSSNNAMPAPSAAQEVRQPATEPAESTNMSGGQQENIQTPPAGPGNLEQPLRQSLPNFSATQTRQTFTEPNQRNDITSQTAIRQQQNATVPVAPATQTSARTFNYPTPNVYAVEPPSNGRFGSSDTARETGRQFTTAPVAPAPLTTAPRYNYPIPSANYVGAHSYANLWSSARESRQQFFTTTTATANPVPIANPTNTTGIIVTPGTTRRIVNQRLPAHITDSALRRSAVPRAPGLPNYIGPTAQTPGEQAPQPTVAEERAARRQEAEQNITRLREQQQRLNTELQRQTEEESRRQQQQEAERQAAILRAQEAAAAQRELDRQEELAKITQQQQQHQQVLNGAIPANNPPAPPAVVVATFNGSLRPGNAAERIVPEQRPVSTTTTTVARRNVQAGPFGRGAPTYSTVSRTTTQPENLAIQSARTEIPQPETPQGRNSQPTSLYNIPTRSHRPGTILPIEYYIPQLRNQQTGTEPTPIAESRNDPMDIAPTPPATTPQPRFAQAGSPANQIQMQVVAPEQPMAVVSQETPPPSAIPAQTAASVRGVPVARRVANQPQFDGQATAATPAPVITTIPTTQPAQVANPVVRAAQPTPVAYTATPGLTESQTSERIYLTSDVCLTPVEDCLEMLVNRMFQLKNIEYVDRPLKNYLDLNGEDERLFTWSSRKYFLDSMIAEIQKLRNGVFLPELLQLVATAVEIFDRFLSSERQRVPADAPSYEFNQEKRLASVNSMGGRSTMRLKQQKSIYFGEAFPFRVPSILRLGAGQAGFRFTYMICMMISSKFHNSGLVFESYMNSLRNPRLFPTTAAIWNGLTALMGVEMEKIILFDIGFNYGFYSVYEHLTILARVSLWRSEHLRLVSFFAMITLPTKEVYNMIPAQHAVACMFMGYAVMNELPLKFVNLEIWPPQLYQMTAFSRSDAYHLASHILEAYKMQYDKHKQIVNDNSAFDSITSVWRPVDLRNLILPAA